MVTGVICPICGREFFPTPLHVYKRDKRTFCSWSCLNRRNEVKHIKREIKKIMQYTRDGEFIKEWESAKQVEDVLGLSSHGVRDASREQRNYKGYLWKYKE